MDYVLRKFGMTLSGRNYIMCKSVSAAASVRSVRDVLPSLQQLVWGKWRVRMHLAQMCEPMYFI